MGLIIFKNFSKAKDDAGGFARLLKQEKQELKNETEKKSRRTQWAATWFGVGPQVPAPTPAPRQANRISNATSSESSCHRRHGLDTTGTTGVWTGRGGKRGGG